MAGKLCRSSFQVYKRLRALPEKSSSVSPGTLGTGGEYECQRGFGWSVGVALELLFLKRFGFNLHEIRKNRRHLGSEAYLQSVRLKRESWQVRG